MRLEFELTADDLRAIVKEARGIPEQRRVDRRGYHNVLSIGLLPVFVVVIILLMGRADPVAYALLVLVPSGVVFVAWTAAYWLSRRAALDASGRPAGGVGLGTHAVVLDADGMSVTMPLVTSRWAWAAVRGASEGRDYVFVGVWPEGHYAVPKRAFGTSATLAAFREFIGQRAGGERATG